MSIQEVTDFADIEPDFMARAARIAWATVATVDRKGRPRTRILHPIWERVDGAPVGYIATGRGSHKGKHLAKNPHVSVSYWDPAHGDVHRCEGGVGGRSSREAPRLGLFRIRRHCQATILR
jgi:pyridoxine/pyridoxamine 5'-phosphate oxidase